ncbi:MAG: glycerol-3-phosphate O-acyltransferase [Ascidiaceihabitans sp.]|jgi:glycerol-3-phosphate O-acyltransferase|tara:strand:- start:3294 stop:4667 length:1374 start_codon:yes stop_codon:yes gene_type:complete
MTQIVELPLWLFVLIVLFAAVTALSHFLLPSVRWFFRRRLERAVKRLNTRLTRPIEPFKLARRYDMIQRLIYDPEVTQAIVNHADKNDVPENVAFEKAQRYAREIVPSFSAFAYFGFAMRVARWLGNTFYDVRTASDNEERLAKLSPDATVIFIMNHRSNMDYVLVTYLASRSSALSYAVGEWARVWPLTRLIKSLGAYFIRRKARGALYRRVLARYVQMATAAGVTQAVFPEGGLSLNGRLMPPKMGLLSYVLEGFDPVAGRDVMFVPVAINYDRVLEDRVLIAASERGDRKFGGKVSVVFKFILRRTWHRMCGQPFQFGTAAVTFGEPISLRSYVETPSAEALAIDLMTRIEDVMPVVVVPLLSRALLKGKVAADDAGLIAELNAQLMDSMSATMSVPKDELGTVANQALKQLAEREIVECVDGFWRVLPENEPVLKFYANSIAHYYPIEDALAE